MKTLRTKWKRRNLLLIRVTCFADKQWPMLRYRLNSHCFPFCMRAKEVTKTIGLTASFRPFHSEHYGGTANFPRLRRAKSPAVADAIAVVVWCVSVCVCMRGNRPKRSQSSKLWFSCGEAIKITLRACNKFVNGFFGGGEQPEGRTTNDLLAVALSGHSSHTNSFAYTIIAPPTVRAYSLTLCGPKCMYMERTIF